MECIKAPVGRPCSARLATVVLLDMAAVVHMVRPTSAKTFVDYATQHELPSSLIVSAMIALSGSASPARRAAETDSPNRRKHGFGSYSIIWYT